VTTLSSLASANGNKTAQYNITIIEKEMTPQQLSKAKQGTWNQK